MRELFIFSDIKSEKGEYSSSFMLRITYSHLTLRLLIISSVRDSIRDVVCFQTSKENHNLAVVSFYTVVV